MPAYLHPVHVGGDTVDDQQRQMRQQNSQPPVHSETALLVWLGFLAEPGISQEGLSRLPDTPHIDVTNWLLQEFWKRSREADMSRGPEIIGRHLNEMRITEFVPEPFFGPPAVFMGGLAVPGTGRRG